MQLPEFLAGDILVFDGRGHVSRGIRLATCSPHTHVAICAHVRQPDLVKANGLERWEFTGGEWLEWRARVLLFESTTLSEWRCVLLGKRFSGVQVHEPADYAKEYPGRIWLLRLRKPLAAEESKRLTSYLLRQVGTPYDDRGAVLSATRWLKYGWRNARASDRSTLFCCELLLAGLEHALSGSRRYHRVNPGTLTPKHLVRWSSQLYTRKEMIKDWGATNFAARVLEGRP